MAVSGPILKPCGRQNLIAYETDTDHRWTTQHALERRIGRCRGGVPRFFTSSDHPFVFAPEPLAHLMRGAGCRDLRSAAYAHVPPGERLHWRAYKGTFRTIDRWRGWGDYMMVVGVKPRRDEGKSA